jgi:thioredoxin-dependent peroxiredoxin
LNFKDYYFLKSKKNQKMNLKIGDQAPAFSGKDQAGNTIQLADYQGNKVVLYFYPKDNTESCTKQACNLRDNYAALQKAGYVVLGVSTDDEKSHRKFIEKQNLPFTLIADTDHSIHDLYGTWQEKMMYGKKYMGTVRTTFVIDEVGKITDIIEKVKTADHTAQILL